jgi:type IV pilus assembly protein PilB
VDIGTYLVNSGWLSPGRLREAVKISRETGIWLGEILIDNGWVEERHVYLAVAQECGLPFVDLTRHFPDNEAIATVPAYLARQYNVLPAKRDLSSNTLWVAMLDTGDISIADELRMATGCKTRPVLAAPEALAEAIRRAYGEGW